jgi:hypothetical protein
MLVLSFTDISRIGKSKKDSQHNGQKKKGQTEQFWFYLNVLTVITNRVQQLLNITCMVLILH